jgi:hypothetical protein
MKTKRWLIDVVLAACIGLGVHVLHYALLGYSFGISLLLPLINDWDRIARVIALCLVLGLLLLAIGLPFRQWVIRWLRSSVLAFAFAALCPHSVKVTAMQLGVAVAWHQVVGRSANEWLATFNQKSSIPMDSKVSNLIFSDLPRRKTLDRHKATIYGSGYGIRFWINMGCDISICSAETTDWDRHPYFGPVGPEFKRCLIGGGFAMIWNDERLRGMAKSDWRLKGDRRQ